MTHEKLIAIVLAGGKSSRMGEDKALLPIRGVPLLQQICKIAESCADAVYVVTPWQERYQDLLPHTCKFIREVYFPEEIDQTQTTLTHGPLIGFAQALTYLQTQNQAEWILLLACDLPNLQVEILQAWREQLVNVRKDAIALLAHHQKGWEPLCGFYRQSCLPGLNEFIYQGGRSFQQWLNQNTVEVLAAPNRDIFYNCNTPEDLLFD
ncbi:molybdenum cofactor guanylyltransferase [Calothrix sp. UHCC 0171]|uniref:molybdenum cofactor guanylyltransferase n=1 Tax=Calothrix sp. UHCC 0171 TaxID=3110245 RepID=UPI002B1F6746|nr:molybdenum cofactor guanylyltransferase [Calothrix sp. UHCC 0171]MEA5571830.1 molybdenum cofactor guanylyltransferase [Calothrix sp. UHCC 0171]